MPSSNENPELDSQFMEASDPEPTRRIVFISHANPEDNPAAAWFATQLTLLGYDVWCDLRNTHGGESEFWLKVQKTIEGSAAKFVYILSNTSCDFERKRGIYKELQTAENLKIDNFIIPVRIERLARSTPILLKTSTYINSENWALGLQDLAERLLEDQVPRQDATDFGKISSWWPGITADKIICRPEQEVIVSNVLQITELPGNIEFVKAISDRNTITGWDRLRKVLPPNPAFYAHGDHVISFASAEYLTPFFQDIDIETDYVVGTEEFMANGHEKTGISPESSRNIVTYLAGQLWDAFLSEKGFSAKPLGFGKRSIWYAQDGVIPKNRVTVAEPGRKRVPIQLIGSVKHYGKRYRWHFGVYPTVDLRTLRGIILTPKIVMTPMHDGREAPTFVDDKRVLKAVTWWNGEWRQKLLAFVSWLSSGEVAISIPVGHQELELGGSLELFEANRSYNEMTDDDVINQATESLRAKADPY